MGCVYSRKSDCINRADERRQPNLRAIADDCQQRILPAMQQSVDCLDICVRDVRLVLAAAQAKIDNYDQIKNPDKRGKITNLNEASGASYMPAFTLTCCKRRCRLCVHVDMLYKYCRLSGVDPFRRLDMEELHALVENLKQVMEELRKRWREIEESLRSTKWWRNACNIVFTVVNIGVIIGSIILAALVAVPIAATSGTAAGALVKTVEQWISPTWEQRKDALEKEQKLVEKMQAALQVLASYGHLEDLPSLVRKVKSDYAVLAVDMEHFLFKFILKDVGACDDDEATAENKVKKMKTKINQLTACMDLLISTADKCTEKIRQAELELSLINN